MSLGMHVVCLDVKQHRVKLCWQERAWRDYILPLSTSKDRPGSDTVTIESLFCCEQGLLHVVALVLLYIATAVR